MTQLATSQPDPAEGRCDRRAGRQPHAQHRRVRRADGDRLDRGIQPDPGRSAERARPAVARGRQRRGITAHPVVRSDTTSRSSDTNESAARAGSPTRSNFVNATYSTVRGYALIGVPAGFRGEVIAPQGGRECSVATPRRQGRCCRCRSGWCGRRARRPPRRTGPPGPSRLALCGAAGSRRRSAP